MSDEDRFCSTLQELVDSRRDLQASFNQIADLVTSVTSSWEEVKITVDKVKVTVDAIDRREEITSLKIDSILERTIALNQKMDEINCKCVAK